jgi:hypothetical protein
LTGDALVGNVLANGAFQDNRRVESLYALHMPALPMEELEEAPINTDDLFSTMEVDAAVTNANGDFAFGLIDDAAAAAAAAQEGL